MPVIFGGLRTEFHGTGTTSMLPLKYGGIVDPRLLVYGTSNLQTVDTGIMVSEAPNMNTAMPSLSLRRS